MTTTVPTTTDSAVVATATTASINDDAIGDDNVDQPVIDSPHLFQHLLFILSSFELVTALASGISISGKRYARTSTTVDLKRKNSIHDFFFPSNWLDFLDISTGCIPVSADADAHQIRWPNWAILLPEIPKNTRFKTQGVS